jgi:hypothetical protein
MPAKIYRFPRQTGVHPEATFIGSLMMLAVLAVAMSYAAPWS